MSFLLQVFGIMMPLWSKIQFFLGCSSLSALTYSSLPDVQKFITIRTFIVSGSVNTRWKDEKLLYVCHV
jgi:hypothetical protein